MWCPDCRQDVPGIAAGPTAKLCCVRCRTPLARAGDTPESTKAASGPLGMPNDAEIAAHLESLERLTSWDFDAGLSPADWAQISGRDEFSDPQSSRSGLFDPPHPRLRGWHLHGASSYGGSSGLARWRRKSIAGWVLLSVGLASFFCGAALLTWSLFGNRPDLWTMGVPITLAGQVGLLLGVVLALDRLGQQNRRTVDVLGRLDERLDELRAAAWLNSPSGNPSGQSSATESAERLL